MLPLPLSLLPSSFVRWGVSASIALLLVMVSNPALAALVEVSFSNGTEVTASNVGAAVGQPSGVFDSGNGRVAIASTLASALGSNQLDLVGDSLFGETGVRWGIQADHCLGAGGCSGPHHFVEATGDLVMTIEVEPGVTSWSLEVGIQSFGNLNGLADGGTLPICTSDMRAFASTLSVVGNVTAGFDFRDGVLAVDDDGDCTQDSSWQKYERGIVTLTGVGSGTFELHLEQAAAVRSEVQSNLFAIKNGSDTCFRAGADPGDGLGFFDACDYPGLVFGTGDRDADGLLGNEPNDGGIWITDRVTGAAVMLTAISTEPEGPGPYVPVAGVPALGALVFALGALGFRRVRS